MYLLMRHRNMKNDEVVGCAVCAHAVIFAIFFGYSWEFQRTKKMFFLYHQNSSMTRFKRESNEHRNRKRFDKIEEKKYTKLKIKLWELLHDVLTYKTRVAGLPRIESKKQKFYNFMMKYESNMKQAVLCTSIECSTTILYTRIRQLSVCCLTYPTKNSISLTSKVVGNGINTNIIFE